MIEEKLENLLANFCFFLLFCSMFVYFIQTAFFDVDFLKKKLFFTIPEGLFNNKLKIQTKISLGFCTMFLANFCLLILLILRWKISGHFPLSNLYESFLFLSWSLSFIHLFLEYFLVFGFLNSQQNFYVNQQKTNNQNFDNYVSIFKQFTGEKFLISIRGDSLLGGIFALKKIPDSQKYFFKENHSLEKFSENQNSDLIYASNTLAKKNLGDNNNFSNGIFSTNDFSSCFIGCITAPCVLFTNAFASFSLPLQMQKANTLVPALQSNWLVMHVTLMILSYAALMAGSLLSIAFIILFEKQEIILQLSRDKKNSFFKNFLFLDNLSYRLIGIGFPCLTIGILSGAVWANEAWGSYWSWDPKETWALLTWFVFAIYLHTRLTKGWQGKNPAIIASIGFVIIWICFLGVNLIGKGLHSYGWIQN